MQFLRLPSFVLIFVLYIWGSVWRSRRGEREEKNALGCESCDSDGLCQRASKFSSCYRVGPPLFPSLFNFLLSEGNNGANNIPSLPLKKIHQVQFCFFEFFFVAIKREPKTEKGKTIEREAIYLVFGCSFHQITPAVYTAY